MNQKSAKQAYDMVYEALSPHCKHIAISGAARRQDWRNEHRGRLLPNAIDIIVIPDNQQLLELRALTYRLWAVDFPEKTSQIDSLCPSVTIHWVTKEQFGLAQFMITGPKPYVAHAKNMWKPGKFLKYRLKSPEGLMFTETEEDVFWVLGRKWQEPKERQ